MLSNDGKLSKEDYAYFKKVIKKQSLHVLENHPFLGRKNCFNFPGWRRSFSNGLQYCLDNNYNKIVFIESDLHIKPSRIENFRKLFNKSGYYTGLCGAYYWPEPSIQCINSKKIAKQLIKLFNDTINSDEAVENQLKQFKTKALYRGLRLEELQSISKEDYEDSDYFAQYDHTNFLIKRLGEIYQ